MTPTELSALILAIVGAVLQIVFRYAPRVSQWYQAHENKGLLMLVFVTVTGAAYVGLSCTPFAAELGIAVTCDKTTVFTLLRAIFIVASSQQLAYLFTRKSAKG
ncbi:MAG: hypothetical protein HY864_00840 [Chloroflexi bacterium]|nr:hypothetical protein [Chloroflexota bacterium]